MFQDMFRNAWIQLSLSPGQIADAIWSVALGEGLARLRVNDGLGQPSARTWRKACSNTSTG